MRKLLWGLALTTSAVISMTFVNAQERSDGSLVLPLQQQEPAFQDAPNGAAERSVGLLKYERTRQDTAQQEPQRLKNYHNELFGTEAPNAAGQTSRPLSRAGQPARSTQSSPDPFANQPIGITLNQATESKGGVTQADFSSSKSDRGPTILQTGAEKKTGPLELPAGPRFGNGATSTQNAVIERPAVQSVGRTLSRIRPAASNRPAITNFTKESAHVVAEWRAVSDINVGQPCKLELVVENKGQIKAANVNIDAFFPASVRLTDAKPAPATAADFVTWKFNSLAAGEKKIIQVTMIPSQRGDAVANANVRFTTASSLVLAVQEPMLTLVVTGPKQVMIGESAPHVVTISNPGTGVAHNVLIEVAIPDGLEHARGKRLKMDVGSLNPKESRTVRLSLVGKAGGKQTLAVVGKSGTELSQTASFEVNVLAPSLDIAVDGPSLRYIGRDARYVVTVTNTGEAMTNNVRTMYAVPKGFEFVSATRGGKFDPKNRTVTWFVGSIDAKKEVGLSLRLRPTTLGSFAHVARASSEHGAAANAQTTTKIEGTASLVLKVADLDDPVEIGRETGYEITVRNDGSKEAKNVGLSIELPNGVKLLRANGPSKHIAESGLVVFKSMPTLAPGKTAKFQIMISGQEEGNQRLRARLTSSSIQEPLTVEELTRFYAD